MILNINPGSISGLTAREALALQDLLEIYAFHMMKNAEKNRYYEGRISLGEVNLGIALPHLMRGLEIGCAWGAKCVDVLAARSMFDGFVGEDGEDDEVLNKIVAENHLVAEYMKACRDELKYGCTFATLSPDDDIGCKIRFHSPETAAARWNGELGRIEYGMAITGMGKDNSLGEYTPNVFLLYMDDAVLEFHRNRDDWTFKRYKNSIGRPLMEALVWNATSGKPFGRSRIKEPVRRLIQGYVRTIANATIGLEFATSPQKYLLGITDDQYDVVINQRFKQYVGSILAATTNPDTGEKPTFGQLQQGNISPHVEMIRILATQFSAATGLTVTDTGVVSEANPTSSDAILAQSQTLIAMAEQLNIGNGNALRSIAYMALAIVNGVTIDELTDDQKAVVAHFKNPAMPSVAVSADAAVKIAASRPSFAETDVYLEMLGFGPADIRRIKAQEQRTRGLAVLEEIEEE